MRSLYLNVELLRNQRGVALPMAMLALLILFASALALALTA